MSLLNFLRPQQAQVPGQQPSPFQNLLAPEVALPMAAMLMGGQGNAQNLGNAFAVGGQALGKQKELQAQTARENQTGLWLRQQDPRYAQMLDSGFQPSEVYKLYLDDRKIGLGNDGAEVYGTPIYGIDQETNKNTLGVIGKDGSFRRLDTGGVQVTPGVTFQDFGTYRQPFYTRSGRPAGPGIAIDNAGAAADTAAGKEKGGARATYESMAAKMPGLEQVVTQLDQLAEKATYTLGGQGLDWSMRQAGMEPRESAVAREQYIAMVNNQILPMLRDTFGAQFTVQEGESLKATLGAPDKSPQEKQAVLKAFIEQKRRDIEALGVQSGALPPPAQTGGAQRYRFNPATGELE